MMIYDENTMSAEYEEPGIGCIGAYLRQKGYKVVFMASYEKQINYDKIKKLNPQIIGIPVYKESKQNVFRFCKAIKSICKDIKICIGGSYATSDGEDALSECQDIDYAIKGEGEIAFHELVRALQTDTTLETVGNLVFRQNNRIKANPRQPLIENLNFLPFQARDILVQNRLKIAHISASRGCKSRCTFCTSQLMWKKWRGRSILQVVDEIESIVKRYNIRIFNFIDNSFEDDDQTGSDRLNIFCDEIIKRSLKISYFANFRSEFHKKASALLMKKLKISGLSGACVGFESGNSEDLRLYGKMATLEDNEKLIMLFNQHKIIIDPGFINFNPYSTFEKLQKNIIFLRKHNFASKLYNIVNSFQMYKGTRMYHRVKNDGLIIRNRKDPYAYHFVDNRIEKLYHYVINFRDNINSKTNYIFNELSYYAGVFKITLNYLENMFLSLDNNVAVEIVINSLYQCQNILNHISEQTCLWFMKLMNLAEKEWCFTEADRISEQYMSMDMLNESLNNLKWLKFYIHKNLIKQNTDITQFLDFF